MKNRPLSFILAIWLCGFSLSAQGIQQPTPYILHPTASESTTSPTAAVSQITAGKYCAFLNAVAASDPHHLYDEKMSTDLEGRCILRSGAVGSYSYSVIQGKEDTPISFLSNLNAMRYCNCKENDSKESFESQKDIDVTEHGSYELQDDQLVAINPNALYLVENVSGYDLEVGSSSLNFKIINTTAASGLAKMSSGGNGKDTSWEEKVAGITTGVGMILGSSGEEHVDERTAEDERLKTPVEDKTSITDTSSKGTQLNSSSSQRVSPLMMFAEEEPPDSEKPDPRGTTSRSAGGRGAASDESSSDTARGTSSGRAEDDDDSLTLDHFRTALAQYPEATRFVIVEDEANGISIKPCVASTSRLALKKNQAENETIIDELQSLLVTRDDGSSEIVASFFDALRDSGDMVLSAERLQEILRKSDAAKKAVEPKAQKWRAAAALQQQAVEPYTQAARARAAGKTAEGNSWHNAENGFYNGAYRPGKAIEAEAAGKEAEASTMNRDGEDGSATDSPPSASKRAGIDLYQVGITTTTAVETGAAVEQSHSLTLDVSEKIPSPNIPGQDNPSAGAGSLRQAAVRGGPAEIPENSSSDEESAVDNATNFSIARGGLSNNRDDCFINSSLQLCKAFKEQLNSEALARMPSLVHFLNEGLSTDKECRVLRKEMATEVINGDQDLQGVVQNGTAQRQEDAADFLRLLLAKTKVPELLLEEKLQKNVATGETKTIPVQPESILHIALPPDQESAISIQDVIQNQLCSTREQRWIDELPENPITNPKVQVRSQLNLRIDSIPPTLVVSLGRFGFDSHGVKNKITINGLTENIILPSTNGEQITYEPTAIICHKGDLLEGGHYVCYRKENGKWVLFNDNNVGGSITDIGEEDDDDLFASKNCYVISYKRISSIAADNVESVAPEKITKILGGGEKRVVQSSETRLINETDNQSPPKKKQKTDCLYSTRLETPDSFSFEKATSSFCLGIYSPEHTAGSLASEIASADGKFAQAGIKKQKIAAIPSDLNQNINHDSTFITHSLNTGNNHSSANDPVIEGTSRAITIEAQAGAYEETKITNTCSAEDPKKILEQLQKKIKICEARKKKINNCRVEESKLLTQKINSLRKQCAEIYKKIQALQGALPQVCIYQQKSEEATMLHRTALAYLWREIGVQQQKAVEYNNQAMVAKACGSVKKQVNLDNKNSNAQARANYLEKAAQTLEKALNETAITRPGVLALWYRIVKSYKNAAKYEIAWQAYRSINSALYLEKASKALEQGLRLTEASERAKALLWYKIAKRYQNTADYEDQAAEAAKKDEPSCHDGIFYTTDLEIFSAASRCAKRSATSLEEAVRAMQEASSATETGQLEQAARSSQAAQRHQEKAEHQFQKAISIANRKGKACFSEEYYDEWSSVHQLFSVAGVLEKAAIAKTEGSATIAKAWKAVDTAAKKSSEYEQEFMVAVANGRINKSTWFDHASSSAQSSVLQLYLAAEALEKASIARRAGSQTIMKAKEREAMQYQKSANYYQRASEAHANGQIASAACLDEAGSSARWSAAQLKSAVLAIEKATIARIADDINVATMLEKMTLQYQKLADYYQRAANTYESEKMNEADDYYALFSIVQLKSAATALEEVAIAKTANNISIATAWEKAGKQYQESANYFRMFAEVKENRKATEIKNFTDGAHDGAWPSISKLKLAGLALKKASIATSSKKPELAVIWENAATQYLLAANCLSHAAKSYVAGKREEGNSSVLAGVGCHNGAEKLGKAIEAEASRKAAKAKKWREIAELHQQSAEKYEEASSNHKRSEEEYVGGNKTEGKRLYDIGKVGWAEANKLATEAETLKARK